MRIEANEMAYNTYKPIVDDICAIQASELEVEHLLDVKICNNQRTCNFQLIFLNNLHIIAINRTQHASQRCGPRWVIFIL